MRRWYVIEWGRTPSRRLADDARDAVRRWLSESVLAELSWISRVTVESTGEVVPPELWRP